jgi:ATP-dependent RNA circularization protein (DNA/RNA ligase family)
MSLYPKIMSPYKRFTEGPDKNKFDFTQWASHEFMLLSGLDWVWTEKIDGTNVRIIWDGYKVSFGGRTDDAQMPVFLLSKLQEMFPEELMEQMFKDKPVILYGEGYGPKIQKGGGNYRQDASFILFDVKIGNWWLEMASVQEIAGNLGIESVPVVGVMGVHDAVNRVILGLKSCFGDFWAEGMVGRAPAGLLTRGGERIIMKVKHKDLYSD